LAMYSSESSRPRSAKTFLLLSWTVVSSLMISCLPAPLRSARWPIETLTGGEVLPGFRLPLRKLFGFLDELPPS
jgi:hypothetical protein